MKPIVILFVALSSKTGRIPIRGQCKLLGKHGGHTILGFPQNTPPPQETVPPLSFKPLEY
ncbi:hypothetical protein [Hyella patelloides]|uniref:hypothetical protein n=1 Tax=Hyella patelloides TaxID=1982969 RepID=UPI0011A96305|nr:hypothetical protein [Hyella patelloides]